MFGTVYCIYSSLMHINWFEKGSKSVSEQSVAKVVLLHILVGLFAVYS